MSDLPGPRGPRAIADLARRLNADPHHTLLEMRETYGPVIEFGAGRYRYVYLLSVEANEYVLTRGSDHFTWAGAFRPLAVAVGETALVLSDGEDHHRRRRVVQPAFHRRRIDGYLAIMLEEANRVLDRWAPGATVDAFAEFRLAIRRVVLRCLFGDELVARDDELADRLEIVLRYVNRPPMRRFDWNLPGLPYRRAIRARDEVDRIVFAEIGRRRDRGQVHDDVLGWLIESTETDRLTDRELRDQVISLVAAGYDTTASAMGWLAATIAGDPVYGDLVRAEVEAVGGIDGLDVDALRELTYTDALVKELLRTHSPAIWSGRRVEATFEFHGQEIPAGAMVLFSPHVTHHLPDQWVEPFAIKPTRFIDGHPDQHEAHPYAYVPFGGGSRRCLGFAFATQELVTMTAVLAARAVVRTASAEPLRPVGTMSAAPAGGVPLVVEAIS